ncbi:uncharacterized protein LOC135846740 [Planococcus citri]|uniref:uncharacterized protein LOC135846740 n=1 Tax=Planococcus citri TaxID=170843 RepID=UPI0031F9C2C7
MSVISPGQRAGYKLVPQLNSEESELSEEELESFYKDGFQIITRKSIQSADYHELDADLNFTNPSKFRIMNSENFDLKAKNIFPTVRENVSCELTAMSKERKISLVLSILLCICTIVVFIILPCDWSNCSCSQNKEKSVKIWAYVFPDKELKGDINLVGAIFGKHHNLLFMARGSILMDSPLIRSDLGSPVGGDLLLLNGLSGKQIWRKHFNRIPTELDCSLIQLKNRTVDECVVLSEKNFVALISSDEGKSLWSFPRENIKYNKDYHQFPVVLPDLDGDGVRELAFIKDINKLVLLSGASGTVLLNNITNNECTEISHLKYIEGLNLSYLCQLKNDSSQEKNVSLKYYLNIPPETKKNARIPQHISRNSNESIINGYRMVVQNEGSFCPNNCTSKIDIINNDNKTVWTHESLDTYVMKPIAFAFNDSSTFGFVFKIWEHEYEGDEVKKLKINKQSYQYSVGYIYQRTVIVVFNSPLGEPLQTINMSLNPILQLQVSNETLQPNPKNQDNSLLILDVNKNCTYQLVTYYSTFEEMKKNYFMDTTATRSHFTLKSYIHMYDLKKEINEKLSDSSA